MCTFIHYTDLLLEKSTGFCCSINFFGYKFLLSYVVAIVYLLPVYVKKHNCLMITNDEIAPYLSSEIWNKRKYMSFREENNCCYQKKVYKQ